MSEAQRELANVLREARALLASRGNNFAWSSWADADSAVAEIDSLLAELAAGRLPLRHTVSVLFAPTGPIQEISLSSGWAEEFLSLARRCDSAMEVAYSS